MIQVFADLYFSTPGRLSANLIKRSVFELISLWEKWSVLPRLLCQNLRFLFSEESRVMISGELEVTTELDIDGSPIITEGFYDPRLVNSDLDGEPIV